MVNPSNSGNDPQSQRRMRALCTGCGAWRESDSQRLIESLSQGARAGSPQAEAIAAAKRSEGPFMRQHLEKCRSTVLFVYEGDPEWSTLDVAKRED
jgi:hypothetical protein